MAGFCLDVGFGVLRAVCCWVGAVVLLTLRVGVVVFRCDYVGDDGYLIAAFVNCGCWGHICGAGNGGGVVEWWSGGGGVDGASE